MAAFCPNAEHPKNPARLALSVALGCSLIAEALTANCYIYRDISPFELETSPYILVRSRKIDL